MEQKLWRLSKLNILRPLFFLCGPATPKKESFPTTEDFEKARNKDRRYHLRDYLIKKRDTSKNFRPIPVILDDAFSKAASVYNLALIEEILAAIAFKTYVFLDTMSTGYELGFFTHHRSADDVMTFLDEDYRQRERCPVGSFIDQTLSEKRKTLYKGAYDCNGYLSFFEKDLPEPIKEVIDKDVQDAENSISHDVCFVPDGNAPIAFGQINYVIDGNNLNFALSLKTFFYFLMYAKSRGVTDLPGTPSADDLSAIFKNALFQAFLSDQNPHSEAIKWAFCPPTISISTGGFELLEAIPASLWLIDYLTDAAKKDTKTNQEPYLLFDDSQREFKCSNERLDTDIWNGVFGIDGSSMKRVRKRYLDNPTSFVISKFIIIKGKRRHITTYRNNHNGRLLRTYHERLAVLLNSISSPDPSSFAYQKHKDILACVSQHQSSSAFLKLDVHHFFESIHYHWLVKNLYLSLFSGFSDPYWILPSLTISTHFDRQEIADLLIPCFFRGSLPIGFVTSPLLSNLYMKSFDCELASECKNQNLIYTRYADDFLISGMFDFDDEKIEDDVTSRLRTVGLTLNDGKRAYAKLTKRGDSFKFLGITMVKRSPSHLDFTISKPQLIQISKELALAVDKGNSEALSNALGKAMFVKHINPCSFNRLVKIYEVRTKMAFPKNADDHPLVISFPL
jgi:hypothetical protein